MSDLRIWTAPGRHPDRIFLGHAADYRVEDWRALAVLSEDEARRVATQLLHAAAAIKAAREADDAA